MAKSEEKIQAQKLRERGQSVKEIAKRLKVSKSSVSIWCRDIQLTKEQIAILDTRQKKGAYRGRLKGAQMQKTRRLEKAERLRKEALKEVGQLNKRDLFIAGIGLYWGEGNRKWHISGLGNSDPEMIRFIMFWFKNILGVNKNRMSLHVGINQIHKNRIKDVERYWSRITGISKKQFTKTSLQKVKNKKIYKNYNSHYGTLHIRIHRSTDLQHRIRGLIDALIQGRE